MDLYVRNFTITELYIAQFYFKGDLEIANSFAFCIQELRIWNHYKDWEDIKNYAYTDMS